MGVLARVGSTARAAALAALAVGAVLACPLASAEAGTLPAGFQEKVAFSDLTQPTAVAFAPDGRVFVAEKSGVIKIFDDLEDPLPSVFADLSTEVYNFWDRGLLGLTLDPQFPTRPYVYVAYTLDELPGGSVPAWGGTTLSDPCPTPPGPTTNGCVVTGRVSRLTVSGNSMTAETPLVTDWCQQFPSHSLDDVAFGSDGALYASAGEGANFNTADWGQSGNPLNPCGDPPGGVGAALSPPTAEGGALRAQDVRTEADPTGLGGAVVRIDPDTGQGLPDNPLAASADANARRIVGFGLRNPFRLAVRPGTDQVWVGEVGWGSWEEIDRILDPGDAVADNFGWPCYEGGESGINARAGAYDGAGLDLCKSLYAQGPGAVVAPYFSYSHAAPILAGESCGTGSSSISGLAFYAGSGYPAKYHGALFFADYSRDCIWAMLPGPNGTPSPAKVEAFDEGAAAPVNLTEGPDGALYYPDFSGGRVWRIGYSAGNVPPLAVATATPRYGLTPLQVQFSGAESSDPDAGGILAYAWDLDGDGQFDDSTAVAPKFTYADPGVRVVRLRVTDPQGASDIASVSIQPGNTPPVVTIAKPDPGLSWAVGDQILFAGSAVDAQDGPPPAGAYSWNVIVHHCPSNCHEHTIETLEGQREGAMAAPDHEYPSWLEFELTVTDSGGLSDTESVEVHPRTVALGLESSPAGLALQANGSALGAGNERLTVIAGSTNTVIAPATQAMNGIQYSFRSWSDGGAAAHDVKADASETLVATYGREPAAPAIAATRPASPGNVDDPRVKGTLGRGDPTKVEIFTNPSCAGAPAAIGSSEEFVAGGIAVAVANNATTTFSARATNAVGGSPCSNSRAYAEDSTAPETTLTPLARRKQVGAAKKRRTSRARRSQVGFAISASEATLRFECSLDGGQFARCASPVVYRKLRPGRHRVLARAVDLAGNPDPTPALRRFRVAKPASTSRPRGSGRPLSLLLRALFDRAGA